ncbi:MAG: hypothetical protein ACOVQ6_20445 [Brevundimonas sp.]
MTDVDRKTVGAPLATLILALLLGSLAGTANAQTLGGFASTQPTARIEYWQQRLNDKRDHVTVAARSLAHGVASAR